MADKEHDGIENERDMSDVEKKEDEARINGIDFGEGPEASKSEQQRSDDEEAKSAPDSIETNREGDIPEARSQQHIPERAAGLTGTVIGNGREKPDHREASGFFQVFIGMAQIFASIATVVAAVLALYTLKEMQIERNNAYRPEIVVTPAIFEGGAISEGEDLLNENVIYLDCQTEHLDACCLDVPEDSPGCLYLEIPYLTLKNIGQGTAKDVQISFSKDWLEDVAEVMSSSKYAYSIYTIEDRNNIEQYYLECSGPDGDDGFNLITNEDMIKRITYIPADDETVNVAFPKCRVKMIAILFSRSIWEECQSYYVPLGDIARTLDIPDPVISITYSDLQGIQTEGVLEIPWTGQYVYLIPAEPEDTEIWKRSTRLKTGFYEDYIG